MAVNLWNIKKLIQLDNRSFIGPKNKGNNLKKIIQYLPAFIQAEVFKKSININATLDQGIVFKIAETKSEFEQAFRLVHDSYVHEGFMSKQNSQMRILPQHDLDSTSVVIAKLNEVVIGTLTIIRDNRLGLPLERVFTIDHLRSDGRKLAEITSLAVKKEFRRTQGGAIFTYLMKYVYEFSLNFFGVDDWVVVVHPRSKIFYQNVLGFKLLQKYPVDYLGAPAIMLNLNLATIAESYRKTYGHRKPAQNLYHFLMQQKLHCFRFPERKNRQINYPRFSAIRHHFLEDLIRIQEKRRKQNKELTDLSRQAV